MEEKDQREGRTWGIFCHLGALSMYLGVPLGNILVPLIIWLIKKDDLPLVDEHGKQSLNFQISLMLYAVIAAIVYGRVNDSLPGHSRIFSPLPWPSSRCCSPPS